MLDGKRPSWRPEGGESFRHPLTRSKRVLRVSLYIELLLLDAVALFLAFAIACWLRGKSWADPDGINSAILVIPLYAALAFNQGAYATTALINRAESFRRSFGALSVTIAILFVVGYFLKVEGVISRTAMVIGLTVGIALVTVVRSFFPGYALRRAGGSFTDELLIVDGLDVPNQSYRHVIDARAEGIEPDLHNPKMLGRLATLMRNFDKVVIAASPERQHGWALLLKGADLEGELVMPDGNQIGAIGFSNFQGMDTVQVSRGPLNVASRIKKRALDLGLTVPVLIGLAPLLLLTAILIKLDSPGPVFFRQPRVGRGNRMFEILKFRSMRTEHSDRDGEQSTSRDDARITRLGRFIRATSIDELPQLINVLRGEMSLVGPRPHALGSLAGDKLFWEVNERYWLRHALKPGITGLAQIRGYRGATHHQEDLEKRLQADLEYLTGWRLWRDVSILIGTLGVLTHKNAY